MSIDTALLNRSGAPTRLKFCADVSLGKTVQGTQKTDDEKFVNYVRAASIQSYGLELDDQRMWMSDAELDKYDLRRDDVLIVEGGAGYGRSAVLDQDMPGWGFQNHVIRVRPHGGSDGRFLNYCVKGQITTGLIDVLVDGATIPALSSEKARELPVLEVSLAEQSRIADYLDRETGEIDAMLGKLDELANLLRLRQERAIEAQIFTSEQTTSLGYILDCLPGFSFPSSGFSHHEDDVPLLRGINVKPHGLDWSETVYWPSAGAEDLKDYLLEPGDVVLGMDRPFIGSGTRVVQVTASDTPALLVQRVLRVRPTEGGHARFIYYALRSRAFREYATPEFTGISVPHLSEGQVRGFRLPLPSPDEQRGIADHLDEIIGEIEAMLGKVAKLRELLIERRAALITDVVTGKKEVL